MFNKFAISPKRAPKVSGQMQRYRRSIVAHFDQIKTTYQEVCVALLKLHAVRYSLCNPAIPSRRRTIP